MPLDVRKGRRVTRGSFSARPSPRIIGTLRICNSASTLAIEGGLGLRAEVRLSGVGDVGPTLARTAQSFRVGSLFRWLSFSCSSSS